MKTCFKCSRTLSISEFYAHPQMKDGLLGKCKKCTRADAEKRRQEKQKDPEWAEKEAERQRKKFASKAKQYPEVIKARQSVRALGQSKDFHWHHWSYLKQHSLDVIKLDPETHRLAHRYMVYDHEQMQYRRVDTMALLDTKEAHESYIEKLKNVDL